MRDFGPTVLRVFVGGTFLMHAYQALVRFTPAGTAAFMASLGLPAPTLVAWLAILVHAVGGIFLILGLFTRWAALVNAAIMAAALVLVHFPQGYFLKVMAGGQRVGGFEFVLLLFGGALALVFTGGGALAVRKG
jgi:putative oxidoreductase